MRNLAMMSDTIRGKSSITRLVYAAGWGQIASMQELLNRGAEINAIPAGFDFAGTPLHYAALRGRRDTVDWLLAPRSRPFSPRSED